MIFFKFSVANPWWKSTDTSQKDYLEKEWQVCENKSLSMQASKWDVDDLFAIDLDLRWFGQDHAGLGFSIELFGYYFDIRFYDHRHWNYKTNRWYTDEESEAERWRMENYE